MGSIAPILPQDRGLLAALDQAHQRYTKVHPASKRSHEEACKVLPGGNTRTVLHASPFPLAIASGESCYLKTIDGVEYLDFLNEYTAGIYGHNHALIRQAIEEALHHGWNYGAHNEMEQRLAQMICARFPAVELVRFVNSGTEANMMALATALAVTRKKKVLLFEGGYHGSTISGKRASDKPHINLPHDFVLGQYNDVHGTRSLLASLPADSLAAILVEPMLGSGGCFAATGAFLRALRELADEYEALLIFDEVMTSRLAYNGLGAEYSITPDLMTVGKYLGGGMSFGAFGGRKDIMSLYDPRTNQLEHPGTFNNNIFSMSAGVAGCRILDKNKLRALNELGDEMRDRLAMTISKVAAGSQIPEAPFDMRDTTSQLPKMFVKGRGSLMCVHFTGPDRDLLMGLFFHYMLEKGIYLAQRGFIALSIELSKEHVSEFISAVESFCKEHNDYLRR